MTVDELEAIREAQIEAIEDWVWTLIGQPNLERLRGGRAWVFPHSLVHAIELRKRMDREIARSELGFRTQVGLSVDH